MKTVLALLLLAASAPTYAHAEEVFRIEYDRNYRSYSHRDLQKRVWDLERAVMQLQEKVFDLERKNNLVPTDDWVCHVTAMGNAYFGTGGSKAVAKANALENCKAARGGDSFFCSVSSCEN